MEHNKHEKKAFETAIDCSLEEVAASFDADIFLQSGVYESTHGSRFINCFSGRVPGSLSKRKSSITIQTHLIEMPKGNRRMGICYDNDFPSATVCTMQFVDHNGNQLAVVDTDNNIWFMDFYHQSAGGAVAAFPQFFDILDIAWGSNRTREKIALVKLRETLATIEASKITSVVLTTEFDTEGYLALVEREAKAFIARELSVKTEQLASLQRTLGAERSKQSAKIVSEASQAFVNGISALKNNPDWEVSDNRLYYKHDILVHQCIRGDLTWQVPPELQSKFYLNGLSLTIESTPIGALADAAHHPNVSTSGAVCIGDLGGQPLQKVMKELPKMLETGGLNSPFNSKVNEKLILLTQSPDGGLLHDDKVKPHAIWEV